MPDLNLTAITVTLTALQAEIAERLNGLGNLKCADDEADDKARITAFAALYEQWRLITAALLADVEKLRALDYPMLPILKVSLKMKARLEQELRASAKADSIIVGTRSAISGTLSFGPTIPKP